MSKQRRPQKADKGCYFFGQSGGTSQEHAWPQWMYELADVEPTRSSGTVGYRRTADDTFTEDQTVIVNRKGSC